jgi:hypothetical protein
MINIRKLIKKQEKKASLPIPQTEEEILVNILRADMEMMLKYGRNGHNLDFPDPVEPQWKN